MIEIKMLGPLHNRYAVISDESGAWAATCLERYAEAVKAAIEAANANRSNEAAQGRD